MNGKKLFFQAFTFPLIMLGIPNISYDYIALVLRNGPSEELAESIKPSFKKDQ